MHGATMIFLERTTSEMALAAANRDVPTALPSLSITSKPFFSSLDNEIFADICLLNFALFSQRVLVDIMRLISFKCKI